MRLCRGLEVPRRLIGKIRISLHWSISLTFYGGAYGCIGYTAKENTYTSLVSHGKNSGGNYATSFSNENGSHKSSLGFYLTENTYQGRNGYSLILNGLEKGINDLAKQRAIVIHGASYSDPSVAASSGRLGRSFGCPALPVSVSKPIINTIKNGTLLFIYANDKNYLTQSSILSTQQENDISWKKLPKSFVV